MGTIDTLLRIKADASQAVRGLKPLQASLDETAKDAQVAEQALDSLDGTHTIRVNDEAVENARKEITRLRSLMREQLRMDPTVDTRESQRRIKQLQSAIRSLDKEEAVIDTVVNVDTTGLSKMQTLFVDVNTALVGGAAGGGMVGGIGAATQSLKGLGASSAVAAGGVGGLGVALAGSAKAAWELGQMSADAETQIAKLDALTQGMGEEAFALLQQWAAETPFAMDEATAATQRLIAAGVGLQDIPDYLNDIGNVAAATPAGLEQVSTIFAQMISKNKASYEELQQLTEAGIGVWSILAEKLGLSAAEVQKLATEGKLGADAINLLRESLNETYSGAMARQAETFNGRMSTFKDTVTQTGQTLGTLFLPAMKDLLEVMTAIAEPTLDGAKALGEWNTTMEDITGRGIMEGLVPAVGVLGRISDGFGDSESAAEDAGDASGMFVDKVLGGLRDVEQEAEDAAAEIKLLEDAFNDAISELGDIGVDVRTRVSFLIEMDDFREAVQEAVQGTADQGPVTLPANLNLKQVGGLGDLQQDLLSNFASMAQTGLEEGVRMASLPEVYPNFNFENFYKSFRRDVGDLLIEAGVDPKEVDRVLTNVVGLPRFANIEPLVENVDEAEADLDYLANPKGGRVAKIGANIDPVDLASEHRKLEELTRDRTMTIHVEYVEEGGPRSGPGGQGPVTTSPSAAPRGGRTDRRAPETKPTVNVYVDGKNIPARADTPRSSGRRVA